MNKYINYNFFKKNKIVFDHEGHLKFIKLSPLLVKNINIKKRKEFIEQVKHFLITMNNKCKNFNIDLFQQNFSKMKFKFYTRNNRKTGIVIFLKKKCKIYDMDSILHELIHLATIRVDSSTEYCGFSINDYYYGDSFAKGLNEGYTQLIKERYFGKDKGIVYPFEVKYASMIEALVGKDKMEELFFTTNLRGLFTELSVYTNPSDFRDFLNNLDFINNNFPPKDVNDKQYQEKFDQINLFLFECFKRKLELVPNNQEIKSKMEELFDKPISCKYSGKKKEVTVNNLDHKILQEYLDGKQKR